MSWETYAHQVASILNSAHGYQPALLAAGGRNDINDVRKVFAQLRHNLS